MNQEIKNIISESILVKENLLKDKKIINKLQLVVDMMIAAFKRGNKVWFCGNGGSAADAQHIAAELSGRFYFDRAPLPAEAMHVNSSYLTAVANDYSYDEIYARYLRGVGNRGDVLVGISTSGNSKNILKAQKVAKENGISVIALTGNSGGEMKETADILLNVPSMVTPRIQEAHIMLGHIICEQVEKIYFASK